MGLRVSKSGLMDLTELGLLGPKVEDRLEQIISLMDTSVYFL